MCVALKHTHHHNSFVSSTSVSVWVMIIMHMHRGEFGEKCTIMAILREPHPVYTVVHGWTVYILYCVSVVLLVKFRDCFDLPLGFQQCDSTYTPITMTPLYRIMAELTRQKHDLITLMVVRM